MNTEPAANISEFERDQPLLLRVLENINAGVALFDEQAKYIFVNEKYCDIYGFERRELIGESVLVIVPREQHAHFLGIIEKMSQSTIKETGERTLQRRDGSVVEIQYSSENIFHDGKRRMLVTVNDVSPVSLMKKELDTSETKFRSMIETTAQREAETRKLIMNSALDAIICIDLNGDVTLWNPQAERIFGWSADEVMGKRLSSIIIPEPYCHMHDAGMEQYKKTGSGKVLNTLLELSAKKRSGEQFPIELTVLPLKQDGVDETFCAFIRDISDRKKAELALKKMNRDMADSISDLAKSNVELEQFAYVASHDLQEPLRMVISFLTQLERKYKSAFDEKGLQYLHFAVDGAVRMRKIIHDLLEYSRADRLSTDPEPVDLNAVVKEIISSNSALIAETGADIKFEKLPVIQARKVSMEQLFQNLMNNALKYCRQSPKVHISVEELADEWRFAISDNGIGIDPRHHDRIFVIFQRLHNREEYSGTGIGLAICKKIVESYGGRIWIESEAGEGAVFYFTIRK